MPRVRTIAIYILLAIALSACGGSTATGNPPATGAASTPSSTTVAVVAPPAATSAVAEAATSAAALPPAETALPSSVADLLATGQALAHDPTRVAQMEATILAQKPSEDGCDPRMQNINADSSTLKAEWTPQGNIHLQGTLDAPADAGFFVFVYNNGAPIYWALFNDVKPVNKHWDYTTTMPAADDLVMGKLSQKNPYQPGAKICVAVTGLKSGLQLSDMTDPTKLKGAVLVEQRIPVGGSAPAAIALPTANPANGAGVCPQEGDLPISQFKAIDPLVAGAYTAAKQGAIAWQPDARLVQMAVGCRTTGDLIWTFTWASDATKQAATNSGAKPTIDTSANPGTSYQQVGPAHTVDPTKVTTTFAKLGDALLAAGFTADNTVSIVGRLTLGYAAQSSFSFQAPDGAPDGAYYRVTLSKTPDDLGTRVFVDANNGKVYKK